MNVYSIEDESTQIVTSGRATPLVSMSDWVTRWSRSRSCVYSVFTMYSCLKHEANTR